MCRCTPACEEFMNKISEVYSLHTCMHQFSMGYMLYATMYVEF